MSGHLDCTRFHTFVSIWLHPPAICHGATLDKLVSYVAVMGVLFSVGSYCGDSALSNPHSIMGELLKTSDALHEINYSNGTQLLLYYYH